MEKPGANKSAQTVKERMDLIDELIETARQRIKSEEFKVTTSDLIRLLQFKQELEAEQPKEIKVTWIEPSKTESDITE
ncbi:MAG: hypothetical protein ABI165_01830 [Bryobacteraceae bacterium]